MRGFPAGVGVSVAGKQQGELVVGVVKIEVHGGGEAAQQRGGDGLGGGF